MLDLCLLGTGGMMPLPKRWLSSLLIRFNGKLILFDCGEGTQIPLKLADMGIKAIDAIFFTHFHGDHIAGLPGLLLTLGNSGREESVTIYGPVGIERIVRGLTVISPDLPYKLIVKEILEEDNIEVVEGLFVKSIPLEHSITCLGYSIELKRQGKFNLLKAKELGLPVNFWGQLQKGQNVIWEDKEYFPEMVLGNERKGLKVTYCTDTRPKSTIIEFAQDSDVFICEGMYGDDEEQEKAIQKKHMTFREAATLAKNSNSKELWLTHYSPSLADPREFIQNATSIFENTILPRDLYYKTLVFEED